MKTFIQILLIMSMYAKGGMVQVVVNDKSHLVKNKIVKSCLSVSPEEILVEIEFIGSFHKLIEVNALIVNGTKYEIHQKSEEMEYINNQFEIESTQISIKFANTKDAHIFMDHFKSNVYTVTYVMPKDRENKPQQKNN